MNAIKKIQAVQNTMDNTTVAGHDNWNRMLACWQALEEVKKELMKNETNEASLRERDPKNTAGTV